MPVFLTSVFTWKWCLPYISFHLGVARPNTIWICHFDCYKTPWYSLSISPIGWSYKSTNQAFFAMCRPFSQLGIILIGSKAFVQLKPISKPTETLSFLLILSIMYSKYFRCSSFDGVATSSWSTGRYLFVKIIGSSIHSPSSSLLLDTFNPSTNVVLLLTINCLYNDEFLLPIHSQISQWLLQNECSLAAAVK